MESLVTVELQLRSGLLFSFGHAQRIGNRLRGLPRACFIRHDAVVVEVANHGQIQHPLAGLDVGNVRYPLLIGLLCESSPRCCPLSTFDGSMHLHSDPQQETSGRR